MDGAQASYSVQSIKGPRRLRCEEAVVCAAFCFGFLFFSAFLTLFFLLAAVMQFSSSIRI
jgi:hypothetical protein